MTSPDMTIWEAPKATCPVHGTETRQIAMECRAAARYRIFIKDDVAMGGVYECSVAACNDADSLQALDDDSFIWVEEV